MRLAPAAFGGGSPNALLALLKAGKHLATAKAGNSVLQAGCVLCDFGHWCFHPEQCRVCFFFCFARPPLFPQSENRKMFLTAKKFYKNILERQKSHPAIEAEWLRKIFLLLRSHVFLKLSAQGDQKAVSLRKGGKKTVAKFDIRVLVTVWREEKVCPGSNGFGIVFLRLASRKFQVFHEYHRHSTHAFCPFLYKTTLSIRSLIFCSPFSVIIYPSLLINRGLKAVCTLDRNKKYITHKQVNGFYKPNSSISFFTSSFFSSERL